MILNSEPLQKNVLKAKILTIFNKSGTLFEFYINKSGYREDIITSDQAPMLFCVTVEDKQLRILGSFPYFDCYLQSKNTQDDFVMETKKNNRANLEKKRLQFFQLGLLLSLGFVLVAFEWKFSPRVSEIEWDDGYALVSIDMMPNTYQKPDDVPPPPKPPVPSLDLNVVSNEAVVANFLDNIDVEIFTGNVISTEGLTLVTIEETYEPEIFDRVEDMPLFRGEKAEIGFRKYIAENLKYPPSALGANIFGRVYVQFIVDEKGKVIDAQVVRGVDPLLDNEALRLIITSTGWTPGKQREVPVKVRYTFPISFQIQQTD